MMVQEFDMETFPNNELLDFVTSVAKLRAHLAGDSAGTALMEDALKKLCMYYGSDPVARPARHVIANVLAAHPHLHHKETRVEDWGFEVAVSCDNCGLQEKHKVVKGTVDIAAALMLGKHEGCKPKLRVELDDRTSRVIN
jgi:hypothetical protein